MKRPREKNLVPQNNPEKARAYAFLLLKFRLRSARELEERLKRKGFSQEQAGDTVNFLKTKEFIDDRVFAAKWAASRLRKPVGLRRIRQELAAKGIAQELIEEVLCGAQQEYSEKEIVKQLAEQRFARNRGVDAQKARARVYAYLLRRGFAPDVVKEVLANHDDC